jgi:diacylglycerol kinase family enzyme
MVYNLRSGSALSSKELRKKCQKADLDIEKLIPVKPGFERKLDKFIEAGKVIAVIGGDGTISAVAGLITGTKAILAPLPGGTLNHFTKDLKIPQDIDEALARLTHVKTRSIDVATVNEKVFINNSSLGLYPASLRNREELKDNKIGKWPSAITSSLKALFRLKTYTVVIDGTAFKTPFIFVGNNKYEIDGGAIRKRLNEGVLTVFVAKTQSRLILLKIVLLTLIGKTKSISELEVYHPKKLLIDTKRPTLHISHDGEVSKMTSPIEYEIRKGALRVL